MISLCKLGTGAAAQKCKRVWCGQSSEREGVESIRLCVYNTRSKGFQYRYRYCYTDNLEVQMVTGTRTGAGTSKAYIIDVYMEGSKRVS